MFMVMQVLGGIAAIAVIGALYPDPRRLPIRDRAASPLMSDRPTELFV